MTSPSSSDRPTTSSSQHGNISGQTFVSDPDGRGRHGEGVFTSGYRRESGPRQELSTPSAASTSQELYTTGQTFVKDPDDPSNQGVVSTFQLGGHKELKKSNEYLSTAATRAPITRDSVSQQPLPAMQARDPNNLVLFDCTYEPAGSQYDVIAKWRYEGRRAGADRPTTVTREVYVNHHSKEKFMPTPETFRSIHHICLGTMDHVGFTESEQPRIWSAPRLSACKVSTEYDYGSGCNREYCGLDFAREAQAKKDAASSKT